MEETKKSLEVIDEANRKSGKIRRIVVDRVKCIGAYSCVEVAPKVFQLDDQNLAYIVDPESEEDDTIQMAAEACPLLAIELYDENNRIIFPQ